MNIGENILLALGSLVANKMRAILTMLGIIIGIGSVIGIMTVGNSLSGSIQKSMQTLGANNIMITLQNRNDDSNFRAMITGRSSNLGTILDKDMLTDQMFTNLRQTFPQDITALAVTETVGSGETRDGSRYANLSLIGINSDYTKANDLTILRGHLLNQDETQSYKKIAVVSDKLASKMFGNTDPLGQTIDITVNTISDRFTIVGVYEYVQVSLIPNTASEADLSTNVFIPLNTALHLTGSAGYQNATIVANLKTNATSFVNTIESFFNIYYGGNKNYTVRAFSMSNMTSTVNTMMNTITLAISLIAAISLLVGGIGVMNIMLVSITERTREIGTRKAIGATNASIRIQFIVESVIICLIGGSIGIGLGLLLGSIGASLLGYPAVASFSNILMAVGFSMAIGVFFGYYPANKAAKMNPIDALRYE